MSTTASEKYPHQETQLPLQRNKTRTWRAVEHPTTPNVAARIFGEPREGMLVRIYSECLCPDAFGTDTCDCPRQLSEAIARIEAEECGALIYLKHSKNRHTANVTSSESINETSEPWSSAHSNPKPGDHRTYLDAKQLLASLAVQRIRLMTNNRRKIAGLGDIAVTRVPHLVPIHPNALGYIQAQIAAGYLINPEMIRLSADPHSPGTPLVAPAPIDCEVGSTTAFGVEWRFLGLFSPAVTDEPTAFVYGEVHDGAPVFIKSSCRECEAMGSTGCECQTKRDAAVDFIIAAGGGVYIHLKQEGRGLGLRPKLKALRAERESGKTTIETYQELGLPVDARDFADVATLLTELGLTSISLLDAPVGKFGTALHGFEVRETPLEYAIPIDARRYYDATVQHGLAFPKETRDELPTVPHAGLAALFALRTHYLNRLEQQLRAHSRAREKIVAQANAHFEDATEKVFLYSHAFVNSAPMLGEIARHTGQYRPPPASVHTRQRLSRLLTSWRQGGPVKTMSSPERTHGSIFDTDLMLAEATAQAIGDAHLALDSARAAIAAGAETLQASQVEQAAQDRADLTDALREIVVAETTRVVREKDEVDQRAVRQVQQWGTKIAARSAKDHRSRLSHFAKALLPGLLDEPAHAMRGAYRILGQTFARTVWGANEELGRSLAFDPVDFVAHPELLFCLARPTNNDLAVGPHDRPIPDWSPIFHTLAGEPALLRPFGRVPEPPELAAKLDADPLEGQRFYKENPLAGEYAPRPVMHDFHRLGKKWTYWAQRSVVGDPPVRVFVYGEPTANSPIRVHSACLLGDACDSDHCECGQQIDASFEAISEAGSGVIIYLDQDGRGAGAIAKAQAYRDKQRENLETFDSYERQGREPDPRKYDDVLVVLQQLGLALKPVRLLTNNPAKLSFLMDKGVDVTHMPLEMPATTTSLSYLRAKAERGHMMNHLNRILDPRSARKTTSSRLDPTGHAWWSAQRPPLLSPHRHVTSPT